MDKALPQSADKEIAQHLVFSRPERNTTDQAETYCVLHISVRFASGSPVDYIHRNNLSLGGERLS
ncbi:hypothetical protein PHLCEN_2v1711 [Hermanssonia centrifuga]|uniref:Uncharacterized protein n=1 Tax=Hermanssonia centrifuga TaxID=98765 RepID=A0A2R6RW76_9APHY|nr:hypothetical protein PHLCEN_2v1711 [Hermanssonia centrifuga]